MKNPIAMDCIYDPHNPLFPKLGQKPAKVILFGIISKHRKSQFRF